MTPNVWIGATVRPSAASRPFWEGAARGRLVIQRCDTCQRHRHPPALRCHACGSRRWSAPEVSGRGVVFSYSIPRYPPTGPDLDGTVHVVVELVEGVRILSRLVGTPPDEVRIGAPVRLATAADGVGDGPPTFAVVR